MPFVVSEDDIAIAKSIGLLGGAFGMPLSRSAQSQAFSGVLLLTDSADVMPRASQLCSTSSLEVLP